LLFLFSDSAEEVFMPTKLIFNGGLFVLLPGRGDRHKVDVLMHTPIPVKITGHSHLVKALKDAERIDFLAEHGGVLSSPLKLRRVSHAMPVKYCDFAKTVGFNAGTIRYLPTKDAPKKKLEYHKSAKKTADPDLQLKHYKRVVPKVPEGEDESLKQGIVQAFASTRDVKWWLPGYRLIEVRLPSGIRVLRDGLEIDWPNGNLVVEFKVRAGSVIPHYPDHNPHVLEQPPTI
jgi:hypothetical protein